MAITQASRFSKPFQTSVNKMAQGTLPPDSESSNPYERLGINPDASFEEVQQAKQHCLDALSRDDAQGRARVESAYDAVLMQRLKERQLGQLTGAAASASKREATIQAAPATPTLPRLTALQNLPRPKLQFQTPSVQLARGDQLWWPLGGEFILLLVLLLAGNRLGTPELVLALSTLLCISALQRRRSRLLIAALLAVAALGLGLVIGSLLNTANAAIGFSLALGLNTTQITTIPALLLLTATAILFD